MPKHLLCAAMLATALAAPAAAQPTPGVEDVAPGVRVIDGAKVPSHKLDAAGLEAAIKDTPSLRALKKLLGGDGVTSVGPGGSTVHMYKLRDTATGKDMIAILFVKGDAIVDHLIQ